MARNGAQSPFGGAASRALRWATAAAIVVACVDGPTDPGRFGELRIRPSYQTGDAPTALGVGVDSARVRIARSDTDEPLVDAMVAYGSDTVSLGWLLELLDTQETMRVDVTIWDDGAQLYSGQRDVQVRDGVIGDAAADLPVAYVGPAIVATVTVSPQTVMLEALGATSTLAAEARDRHGVVVTTPFAWSSGDNAVAAVDPATGVVTAVRNGTTTVVAAVGAKQGSATIIVAQRVASIAITPATTTLTALGATQALTAAVTDPNGHDVAGATVTWSSSDPAVASVDPATGVVTAVAGGAATITASSGAVESTAHVTVNPVANVASVVVSPSSATLTAVGATRQFTAVASDAGGNVLAGVQFTWARAAADVATIDPVTGLARAIGHGATTVTATAGSVVGSATLTVNLTASIASIAVSPESATLTAVGATQQFAAEARDANGAVLPGVPFAWSSSTPAVATVDPASGLASAVAHGSTIVVATSGQVSGSATLGVSLIASVASIVVSPEAATLAAIGGTRQFTAVARDANGAVVPGVTFTWSSSAQGVATIDPESGLATAAGHGATTISASTGAVSGSASLTVNLSSTIASIVVTPGTATLTAVGATQQFTAVARDANGILVPGVPFTWGSSATDVATIDLASGLATAAGHGATTISASTGAVSGSASLTVNLSSTIASIVVTPGTATLTSVGATQQFTAVARDANGVVVPVATFEWSSSAPAAATVHPASGLATAVGHGSTSISASVGGVSGVATLHVELTATIASITVTPETATLTSLGATTQFSAVAHDASGSVVPGVPFTWSSSAQGVATIDPATGLATAVAHGASTIVASAGSVSGSASLTVNLSSTIASIVVTPGTATLTSVGATQQFTAVARDANGVVVPVATFAWSSSAPEVALVNPTNGLATAIAHGSATISAAVGGVSGGAALHVELSSSIASISVAPDEASLTSVGATQQFTAVARDANGVVVPVATFEWSGSAPAVATVDPSQRTGDGCRARLHQHQRQRRRRVGSGHAERRAHGDHRVDHRDA